MINILDYLEIFAIVLGVLALLIGYMPVILSPVESFNIWWDESTTCPFDNKPCSHYDGLLCPMNNTCELIGAKMFDDVDCEDYGSKGGCDTDCPVLKRGGCKIHEEVIHDYLVGTDGDRSDIQDILNTYGMK